MLGRLASRYSQHSRRQKARRILALMRDMRAESVLVIGVESEPYAWSNIVEHAVVESGVWAVTSGLGPEIGVGSVKVLCDGRRLPFRDHAFDLVVSNAVIEHVGDASDQHLFAAEHARVGKAFVLTTPNRWFPIESHTRTLFKHYSHRWRSAQSPRFTRLLSHREFRAVLPARTSVRGGLLSPTLFAVQRYGATTDRSSQCVSV